MYVSAMVKNNGNTKTVFFSHLARSSVGAMVPKEVARSTNANSSCSGTDNSDCRGWEKEGLRNGCSDCNGCSADDDRVRVHSPAVVAAYCQVTFTVPARCFRWIPLLRYYCTRSGGWRCWNHRLFCFLWHIPFYSSQKCPCWGSSRGSLWHQCSWVCSRFPHSQLVVLVAASEHRETTSEHPGVRRTKDLLFA